MCCIYRCTLYLVFCRLEGKRVSPSCRRLVGRIEHLYRDRHNADVKLFLHYGDLTDSTNLVSIITKVRPTELYNLAAQSHVKVSFEMAEYTAEVDGVGTLR